MEKKVFLEKEISLLKNIIQDIIDKYIIETDVLLKEELLISKGTFVEKLNNTINLLKTHDEITTVLRESDSLNYHRVKNKHNSSELMQDIKQKREDAKDNFEKIKLIEIKYNEKEIKNIPGFLFFNKDIIDMYGMCPFIELSDTIYYDRQSWLNNTSDNGLLYYQLYDKIINKTIYNQMVSNKKNLELNINDMHLNILSELEYALLEDIKDNIIEYNSSKIKNKKTKEKFKKIIDNTNSLFISSGLQINSYLSEYYSLNIPNTTPTPAKNPIKRENTFLSNDYYSKTQLYKQTNEQINFSLKFISNTICNLNQLLYEYLYMKSNMKYNQLGKFYKKWSILTNYEKLDRYESFSENFINKYLVEPKLIDCDDNKVNDIINSLKNIFKENYLKIKYKSIKWNVNKGIIERVFCLKYNNIKEEFSIVIDDIKQVDKVKKPVSIRTILNKDTDKVINEEILIFIIQSKKNGKCLIENIKESKELITEKIKEKLHLKRLTIKDKVQIHSKFDEIYTVIINTDD